MSVDVANDYLVARGTTDVATDGLWHFGAVTFDGVNATGHIAIYLDGTVEVLTVDTKFGTGYTAHDTAIDVEIGRYATTDAVCFDGGLALSRIITRAMSAEEIAGIWNTERHLFGR